MHTTASGLVKNPPIVAFLGSSTGQTLHILSNMFARLRTLRRQQCMSAWAGHSRNMSWGSYCIKHALAGPVLDEAEVGFVVALSLLGHRSAPRWQSSHWTRSLPRCWWLLPSSGDPRLASVGALQSQLTTGSQSPALLFSTVQLVTERPTWQQPH